MSGNDTFVALATPAGESALAMIRISGPLAPHISRKALGSNGTLRPRYAAVSYYHDCQSQRIDQVVATYFPQKDSYTGDEMLEISCHGNPFIAQKILEDLIARGCRIALPGEFTRTAFLNGKMDLSQAEAVNDLIRSCSDKALQAAQHQLSGGLGKKIKALIDHLLQLSAELEAYLDFPEEGLPVEKTDGPVGRLKTLITELEQLEGTHHYHGLLYDGLKTVIVGPPNAGKSSLLNALMGQERAIVSPQPGTTRDFISERIVMGPYCLRIIDTAGLHAAASEIEQLGIQKTLGNIQKADFYLFVLDSTQPLPKLARTVKDAFLPHKTLVLENKIDCVQTRSCAAFLPECPHFRLSLLSGSYLEPLRHTLIQLLEKEQIVPEETALVVNARHATALRTALKHLQLAVSNLQQGLFSELVALELRETLHALETIMGRVDHEAILDKLFATFCIGK